MVSGSNRLDNNRGFLIFGSNNPQLKIDKLREHVLKQMKSLIDFDDKLKTTDNVSLNHLQLILMESKKQREILLHNLFTNIIRKNHIYF